MTSRTWPTALMALVVVSLACVRNLRTPPPPANFDGTYHRFPTGLQLAVYEDPTAARVAVTVSYGAGGLDDPSGQEGTAHLVEHLTSHSRSAGDRSASLEARMFALGADENAFTNFEETVYVADVPKDRLGAMLSLEAERMRAPMAGVTEEEFATERSVVETEMYEREHDDTFQARISLAMRMSFAGHVYGRSIAGTERSLRSIELAHARRWAASQYTPDNAVIVVSGPVSAAEVRPLVEKAFAGLATGEGYPHNPPASRVPPEFPEKLTRPRSLKTAQAAVKTRELWYVWPLPGRDSGEEPKIRAAAAALRATLHRQFRFDSRVNSIDVMPYVLQGITLVMAQLALDEDADALQVHSNLMERFEVPRWSAWSNELADAVANGLAEASFESLSGRIGAEAAQHVRTHRRSDFAGAWRADVNAGIDGTLYENAHAYFPKEQARALLLLPQALSAGGAARDAMVRSASRSSATASLPPDADDPRDILTSLPKAETFTLVQGVQVVVVRHTRLPQVHSRFVFRTRPAALTDPEVTWMAAVAAGDFGRHSIFGSGGDRFLQRSGTVLARDLDRDLDGLSTWVRNTDADSTFHRYLRDALAHYAEKKAPAALMTLASFADQHLLAAPEFDGKALAARLRELKLPAVTEWLEHELRPQNATLILVGDLPPTPELKEKLEWKFLGWGNARGASDTLGLTEPPRKSSTYPWPAPPPAPTVPAVLLYPENSALTKVSVTVRGPELEFQQASTWSVLTELLRRRLTAELRERRGIAYDVAVTLRDRSNSSFLTVSTSVRPELAAEVTGIIRQALTNAASGSMTEQEVRTARWETARHVADGFDTIEGIGERLQSSAVRDAPPSGWVRYQEELSEISAASLQQLAQQLALSGPAIVAIGNLSSVEEAFKAQSLVVKRLTADRP